MTYYFIDLVFSDEIKGILVLTPQSTALMHSIDL